MYADVLLANRKVVSSLCVGLAETTTKIGPAFLENRVESFANIAVQVLEQKAICQQDPDQDEAEDAPEDSAEYDSILISSAGDLVASLANALGPDFAQAFNTFFNLISKYYVRRFVLYIQLADTDLYIILEKDAVAERQVIRHRRSF